jgi:hypothetical protein
MLYYQQKERPNMDKADVSTAHEANAARRLVRRAAGVSGIGAAAAASVSGSLYFVYSGNPPTWNVLTRDLLNLIAAGLLLVFLAALRSILLEEGRTYEWVVSLLFGTGLVYVAVLLVKTSLEAGVVLGTRSGAFDPTTYGPLAHANILMHGSVTRLLDALLLAAAGFVIRRGRALPRWAGTSAYVLAVVNLAFVPSLYFGTDPGHFYSGLGWGNTALTAGLLTYWCAAVGIAAMARSPRN